MCVCMYIINAPPLTSFIFSPVTPSMNLSSSSTAAALHKLHKAFKVKGSTILDDVRDVTLLVSQMLTDRLFYLLVPYAKVFHLYTTPEINSLYIQLLDI